MDAVLHYQRATRRGDIEALLECLSPDAELVSPISNRLVFRSRADLRVLLTAVHRSLRGLEWTEERGDDTVRFVAGRARLGPLGITDITRFDLAEDGRIRTLRPHLRPWLPLTVLGVVLAVRLARHPAVLVRALARTPDSSASADSTTVRIPVSAEVATMGVLDDVDHADAFSVNISTDLSGDLGERLSLVLAETPRWLLSLVRAVQRHGLGLRLGPARSVEHPLGWTVITDDRNAIVLGVEGRLITPRIVATLREHRLVVTTLVRYEHPAARPLWSLIAPIHRSAARYLLDRAARTYDIDDRPMGGGDAA